MYNNWKDLIFLPDNYKKIVNLYFKDKCGKFIINNNILEVDIDSWGIDYFYIDGKTEKETESNNSSNNEKMNNIIISKNNNLYYNIKHDNFKKIYSIGLLIQIGNWNVFKKMEDFISNFKNININIYFFIINEYSNVENIDYLKYKYKNCVIASCENRGMDIGPFLLNLHYMKYKNYYHEYIFKIHTKTCDKFRNETLDKLMKNHDTIINNIIKLYDNNVGIIAGNILYKYNDYKDAFLSNIFYIKKLIKYLYNEDIIYNNLEFVGGTMFIAKLKIFNILSIYTIINLYKKLNNNETLDYYWYSVFYNININDRKKIYLDYINNKENRYANNLNYSFKTNNPGLRDSMIEHSIERVFGYMCKKEGLQLIT